MGSGKYTEKFTVKDQHATDEYRELLFLGFCIPVCSTFASPPFLRLWEFSARKRLENMAAFMGIPAAGHSLLHCSCKTQSLNRHPTRGGSSCWSGCRGYLCGYPAGCRLSSRRTRTKCRGTSRSSRSHSTGSSTSRLVDVNC